MAGVLLKCTCLSSVVSETLLETEIPHFQGYYISYNIIKNNRKPFDDKSYKHTLKKAKIKVIEAYLNIFPFTQIQI